MKKITQNQKRDFVQSHVFGGNSIETSAKNAGMSAGSGQSIVNDLKQKFGSDIAFTIDYFKFLKKQNLSKEDFVAASSFLIGLQDAGYKIGPDLPDDFVSVTNFLESFPDADDHTISEVLTQVVRFMKDNKINLSELSGTVQSTNDDLKQKKQALDEANQQLQETRKSLDAALEEKNKTIELLEKYAELDDSLAAYNINIHNLERLQGILEKIKETGWDAKNVIESLGHIDSLSAEKERLENDISCQRKKITQNQATISSQQSKIESYSLMLNQIENLEAKKITLDDLSLLNSLASDISSKHKIKPKEAWNKLIQNIRHDYDISAGFQNKIDSQQKQLAELENKTRRIDLEFHENQTRYNNEISTLKQEKESLEKTNHSLKETFDHTTKKLDEFYKTQTDAFTKNTDKLFFDNKKQLEDYQKQCKATLTASSDESLKQQTEIVNAGKKDLREQKQLLTDLGRHESLVPLYKIINEDKLDDNELHLACCLFLKQALKQLNGNLYYETKSLFDEFFSKLRND